MNHELIGDKDIADLKAKILASGLTVAQLVSTAWASASTFRRSDKRGGANGARIRLEPQKDWEVNNPAELAKVLSTLEGIRKELRQDQVSLADLIVLGGTAAVEKAAKDAGVDVKAPFTPGRMDATQEQTDVQSFAPLEPRADGFRNYVGKGPQFMAAEEALVDRAQLLTPDGAGNDACCSAACACSAPMRAARSTASSPTTPGKLTNDFFVNLLDMNTVWSARGHRRHLRRPRPQVEGPSSGPRRAST